MREIKFRAWDGKRKIMFQWDELSMDSYGAFTSNDYSEDDNADYILNQNAILMQYTGLKDKNGKEIYEGDIVKEGEFISEVVWEKYMFNVKDYYNSFMDYPSDAFSEAVFEIIGNIYENPELLK